LIVDDNHDSTDMLATLLQFAGHETFAAHDGSTAVEVAAKLDPDIILPASKKCRIDRVSLRTAAQVSSAARFRDL
jgi:CheY-like chemotaxis protein